MAKTMKAAIVRKLKKPLARCFGPPWISARVRSLYRTGLEWAIWVTSVRSRREDRSPSLLVLS